MKTLLPEVSTIFRGVMLFVAANLLAVAAIIIWPQQVLMPLRRF